jgi:ATP-dependent RNA helicase DbpA
VAPGVRSDYVAPMTQSFTSLGLPSALEEAVLSIGYTALTPIQAAAIPPLLEGRDLVGQSHTGSGKTVAFALPILARLRLAERSLQALIVCPTRELSAQVARELRKLGRTLPGLSVLVLAGGEPLRAQAQALARGVHVAVGTPGRLLDHLERESLALEGVRTVVLDEADRMLDMGFLDSVERILAALPRTRQTVLFSATLPSTIDALSRRHQRDPESVKITEGETPREALDERVLYVESERKPIALRRVLETHAYESALVFTNFKASAIEIEKSLAGAGVSVGSLHGDLEQFERDRMLAKFRNGSTRVLIATDVAARGIDVDSLDLVINYDLPSQPEVYVHRVGRTGRAGKSGVALSFATSREQKKLEAIAALTQRPLTRAALPAREEDETAPQPLARDAKMVTLKIAGGRKQKVRPGDILGALTGEAGGLPGDAVGKIEIHDNFAYVAVSADVSERALTSLSRGRIKGKRFVVTRVA